MGRRAFVILVGLVVLIRSQDTYHEALLEYFEEAERLEQGSGGGPGFEGDTEVDLPPGRIIRCLKCAVPEERPDACTPQELSQNLNVYTVDCRGRCLNITAGPVVAYDCANDNHYRADRCIQRVDTRICVCSKNLCNAPEGMNTDEEDYFETKTLPPPYIKEIVPQKSHENSCCHVSVSFHLLAFSALITMLAHFMFLSRPCNTVV
ncbi:uncharacterized protein LOC124268478 [Haliotis rubra]|uniref:uncharacterized protein LOC124268478 n=1 Tax=Haliotis rubra TaxID=36100 RepID=UPI001EE5FF44|nr:uncharacterized protein LOC124268478 [Haliotis rubra]